MGIGRTIKFNAILTITSAISKNLSSSGTQWLPIMTYIHPLTNDVSIVQKLFVKLSKMYAKNWKIL
jgi:hypothetical protein